MYKRYFLALATSLVAFTLMGSSCSKSGNTGGLIGKATVPSVGTPQYNEAVQNFFSGALALRVGDATGGEKLEKAKVIAPGEPAILLNLALDALRTNQTGKAMKLVNEAKKLAPESPEVLRIEGFVEEKDGKLKEAKKTYDVYLSKRPNDLLALYSQQSLMDQLQEPDADKKRFEILEQILQQRPGNIFVLLEAARTAAKTKDENHYKKFLGALSAQSNTWPQKAQIHFAEFSKTPPSPQVAIKILQLRNLLMNETFPKGIFDRRAVQLDTGESQDAATLPIIDHLLKMQNPPREPAEPDMALTYTSIVLDNSKWHGVQIIPRDKEEGFPQIFAISQEKSISLDGKKSNLLGASDFVPIALDREHPEPTPAQNPDELRDQKRDFKNDIIALTPQGAQILVQGKQGLFTPQKIIQSGEVTQAFSADIDLDGDLDVILSTKDKVITLQNRGANTFSPIPVFTEVKGARAFAYGDLDNEGTPDACFVDSRGQLFVYRNQRSGHFTLIPSIENTNNLRDITIFDAKNDGIMDIVGLKNAGATSTIMRVFTQDDGATWKTEELAKSSIPDGKIFIGDVDNNGALDIIVAGEDRTEILLGDSKGGYAALPAVIPARVTGVTDLKEGGYLSLVGVDSNGKAMQFDAKPTKNYHSLLVQTSANILGIGDRRINPFGVGSQLEIRAGLLWQKQIVTGPQTHFGMGTQTVANAIQAIWTNGVPNAVFDGSEGITLKTTARAPMAQRLHGSCPFLFAWDGTKFAFITDCIWRSPLGLKINAQVTAGVGQTEDWLKIRGDQLKAKDGFYDLRITAELWETHFFDHVGLMAVDHPQGTDVFVDERFAIPAPSLKVHAVKTPQAIARATADTGEDVTALVAERDLQHVDTFGRGEYQGVTRDHYIEITLPDSAPTGKPIYVIANGWIHPTDTSINVAIGQRTDGLHPTGLSLEVPDARGNWHVARPGMGFPEGKVKTVLFRVDDLWEAGAPRKLRLRTNLEIYWDQVRWAEGLPDSTYTTTPITVADSTLHYRGFSQMRPFRKNVPELPACYSPVASTGPKWRDLEGNYTRFGDVRPLLAQTDDRYVIMNAGDEMHLRFPEVAAPKAGMVRDYVFIGDGWVKDGNFNTTFSHTVMPLPTHKDTDYKTPPGALTDDPAYKLHPRDWEQYHTRYVSPRSFAQQLKP
jgi:tetratricopeptide (TPR) repeat protein